MYHKWQSYHAWFLRYGVQLTKFFVILDSLLPFCPPINPKNQNFEKNGKTAWRYYHFTEAQHKSQSHDVWFLRYGAWWTKCFVMLDLLLPFYAPNNLKNKNFEKMKKLPGDIIIWNMCTINDNHVMYGFWDIEHHRPNALSFWTIFLPFTPLTTQKIKILKKWKKPLEILSFYTCVP